MACRATLTIPAVCGVLLLTTVAGMLGCVPDTTTSPPGTTQTTLQAATSSSTSGSSSTLTTTAAAKTLTTLPPLATGVPSGTLLEEVDSMPSATAPETEHYYLIDFGQSRLRFEGYVQAKLRFVNVIENGRIAAYTTFDGSSRVDPANFREYVGGVTPNVGIDFLAGSPMAKVGEETLNGSQAEVYRVQFNNSSSDEIVAEYALIYIDSASGLRVREEWMVGSEKVRDIRRQLVTPSPALDVGLTLEPAPAFKSLLGPRS